MTCSYFRKGKFLLLEILITQKYSITYFATTSLLLHTHTKKKTVKVIPLQCIEKETAFLTIYNILKIIAPYRFILSSWHVYDTFQNKFYTQHHLLDSIQKIQLKAK